MKVKFIIPVLLIMFMVACGAQKDTATTPKEENVALDDISTAEKEIFESKEEVAVEIANEETEYEIIIFEPGFYNWLVSIAKPPGYYTQSFLENRNQILVTNWNFRVNLPTQYDPNLYMLSINYDHNIDYGYDVNYKLYNYFVYFQRKYNQRLGPFLPRI